MQDFNWDRYYGKGEELYGQMARNESVYDPGVEGVPMFGEKGQYTPEYKEAKGMKDLVQRGNMTPREAYFMTELMKLREGMPQRDRATGLEVEMMYGKKPRYSKGESGKHSLVSPYQLEKFYRGKTKDMDPFGRMDFDPQFEAMVKSIPTDTTSIEDKLINDMKESDNKYNMGE